MTINRRGITRTVFIFKNFVIKVPNARYSWYILLKGLLANMDEGHTWKSNSGKCEIGKSYLLCPVIWYSWGGWILIMKKADICKDDAIIDYSNWIDAGFGGDDKTDNYGVLNGKIVKTDYA